MRRGRIITHPSRHGSQPFVLCGFDDHGRFNDALRSGADMCGRHERSVWALLTCFILVIENLSALELRLVNATTGESLENAAVTWRTGTQDSRGSTDSSGKVTIPDDSLRLTARKQGFAPVRISWDAAKVPPRFELKLPEAETVGGRVLEQTGQPVEGAEIILVVPQRLAGPTIALDEFPLRSNPEGHWSCDFMPKNPGYVLVEVSHPNYRETDSRVSLEALRAGKAESRLFPVTTVNGTVLDRSGAPIPNADVFLGTERGLGSGSSLAETRTDANGHFQFSQVDFGKRTIGVKVDNWAPSLQFVEVKRDLPALKLELDRGNPIQVK